MRRTCQIESFSRLEAYKFGSRWSSEARATPPEPKQARQTPNGVLGSPYNHLLGGHCFHDAFQGPAWDRRFSSLSGGVARCSRLPPATELVGLRPGEWTSSHHSLRSLLGTHFFDALVNFQGDRAVIRSKDLRKDGSAFDPVPGLVRNEEVIQAPPHVALA